MRLPSNLSIGEQAYFQPDLRKIKIARNQKTHAQRYYLDDSSMLVKVVGVSFTENKVYYDLVVPDGEGSFYSASPLYRVDSIMVQDARSRDPVSDDETLEDGWWYKF